MLLQISTLTTEKRKEGELRNYMQLERVNLIFSVFSRKKVPPHVMVSARTCLINQCLQAHHLVYTSAG